MSFILEALKRADRERRQADAAPGSPPPMAVVGLPDEPPRRSAALGWVAAGALLVLLAVAAWRWSTTEPPAAPAAPPAAASPALAPAAPPAPPAPPVAALPVPGTGTQLLPGAPAATVPGPGTPAPPAPAQAQTAFLPPPTAAAKVVSAPPFIAPTPIRRATSAAPTLAAAPASAPVRSAPVPLKDLPPDLRQQLPPLKLSGSIYSPSAANRLVIVDGQVAHEGDAVAQDVVLEQIQPRSAVFRYRQHRVEVPY